MKNKGFTKIIACCAAFVMLLCAAVPAGYYEAAPPKASLSEQRDELERQLAATEQKLKELDEQSKDTEEYIAVLGEKISYLNKEYHLSKQEAAAVADKVTALEENITANESEIKSITAEISTLEQNIVTLNEQFQSVYTVYCQRVRAIYISGMQGSILSFLLQSDGISNFMTRMQMVAAISKRDGALMQQVQEQTGEIMDARDELNKKNTALKASQKTLKESRKKLDIQRESLLKKQEEMEEQRAEIEKQQKIQNDNLLKLHEKTKNYGEFRDITQAELDEIDAEIEAADKKYQDPPTTTKKPTTTTTTTTTTQASDEDSNSSTTKKPKTTTTTTTTTTTQSSSYIKLTYPCPRYTTITCGFGAYEGHTGCDFSTHGNENQKIVAAESGTVILVRLLERSYGHYIVIRHDKTTSGGKSVYTLYAHNNDIIVSEGQYVKKGQQIAYSGTTGNSTGPHCHFEVRVGGSQQRYAQNPANYLP